MDDEGSAALLSAMANGKRLAILKLLVHKEIAVSELAEMVDLSQSALSQHLAKLRSENLVTTRRQSQTIFYSCHSPAVKAVLTLLSKVAAQSEPAPLKKIA